MAIFSYSFIVENYTKNSKICSEQELQEIAKLCDTDENASDLCSIFCSKDVYTIEQCYQQHKHKKLVFKANTTVYGKVIVKSLESPDNFDTFDENPSEFNKSVKTLLKEKYEMENWSQKESLETEAQRRSFWNVINTNEYVFSEKYKEEKIFTPIIGKCTNFLVSKKLSILDNAKTKYFNTKRKLHVAMNIVKLVEKLDNLGLSYCDFKMVNIGWDKDDMSMKVIDADNIRFKSKIEGQRCDKSEDCFQKMGCSSKCTKDKVCQLLSSNIQYVCSYIFLHPKQKTGLLATASEKLKNVIIQCKRFGFDDLKMVHDAIRQELKDRKRPK